MNQRQAPSFFHRYTVAGTTSAYRSFVMRYRCPSCRKRVFFPQLYHADGSSMPLVDYWSDRGAMAGCPHCKSRFPIWKDGEAANELHRQYRVLEIIETNRELQSVGEERRVFDNLLGTTSMQHKLGISRTVTQSVVIEHEKVSVSGQSKSVGLDHLSLQASAEETLRQRYTKTEESATTRSEELVVEVPPKTRRNISIDWQSVWQEGNARISDGEQEYLVPFRVLVDVTFEVTQIDEASTARN